VKEVMGTVDRGWFTPDDFRGRFFEPFLRAWRLSTDLANWAMTELLRHDTRRTPDMTRLPPFTALNLYRRWNEVCPAAIRDAWDGSTQAAAATMRAVEQKWKSGRTAAGRNTRVAVLWLGEASACTYRFPFPVHVPGQAVDLAWQDHPGGRFPVADVLLPGVGRVRLRVDQGRDWRRQVRDFDALVTGAAVLGDVKVCADMANGKLSGVKLMAAGRFRRRPAEPSGVTAVVRTDPLALLVVELPQRDAPFVVHRRDLLGHLSAEQRAARRLSSHERAEQSVEDLLRHGERHERHRDARADDLKSEKRWPARRRRRFVEAGAAARAKYANRVDTITKQVAACVAGFLRRNRVEAVVYDDTDQTYARHYRYFALRERVRQNCDAGGIRFQTLEEAQAEGGVGE
jgi:hypothetical protein